MLLRDQQDERGGGVRSVTRRSYGRAAPAGGLEGCSPCGSGSTSPTTAPTSTAGRPSRPAHRAGRARGRAGDRAPGAESVGVTCAGRTDTGVHARGQVVHLDVEPDVLSAAAGRSTAPAPEALLRRLNGVLPVDVRVRAGGGRPGRLRRPLLRALAALRLPHRRRPRAGRPAGAHGGAGLAAAARPRRDERGRGDAGGGARLRGLLPQARGRDHDPHPARPALGPRRRRAGGRDRAGRRLLPQHGARAGRRPGGGRGGTAYRRSGPARCCAGRSATRGDRRCTRTGSPSSRSATPPTTELAAQAEAARVVRTLA